MDYWLSLILSIFHLIAIVISINKYMKDGQRLLSFTFYNKE